MPVGGGGLIDFQYGGSVTIFGVRNLTLRELSVLKLGTGVEEFLEGYQTFLLRFTGVSNIAAKLQNI